MKRKYIKTILVGAGSVLIFLMIALLSALPSFAAPDPPLEGVRVNMYIPEQTLTAGEPFYIRHGWTLTEGIVPGMGAFDFNIIIDGVPVDPGLRYLTVDPNTNLNHVYHLYNFPNGLPEGTYNIHGFWYLPCEDGSHPDTCTSQYQSVASYEMDVILIVTP